MIAQKKSSEEPSEQGAFPLPTHQYPSAVAESSIVQAELTLVIVVHSKHSVLL